jgi:DNA recombination protein RmuC
MEIAVLIVFSLIVGGGLLFFIFRKLKVDKVQSDSIKDLERRITDLIMIQQKEIRESQSGVSRDMRDQMHSFTLETSRIKEELKQMQEKMKNISTFQEIFKSPKLRGQWGEASLEHILSQHFPEELYEKQYLFSSGERVDVALKLPNKRLLPIDSKFPSENFAKMAEVSDQEKLIFQKKFIGDVKGHIDKIASKYILPAEGTVDFALMYVPAEAVYYEVINNISKDFDLINYAWSKKIIISSPNTIYLTLRTIEHWFKDTQISQRTQEILKRLEKINQDADKLMSHFRRLGAHLRNALSSYNSSEKRLSLFSGKVNKLKELKVKKLKNGKTK